jgi:hypothetical protein
MNDLKPHEKPLTHSDLKALSRAVSEAVTWRGSMVGNPDPLPLAEFDAFIKRARKAVRKVRELKRKGL